MRQTASLICNLEHFVFGVNCYDAYFFNTVTCIVRTILLIERGIRRTEHCKEFKPSSFLTVMLLNEWNTLNEKKYWRDSNAGLFLPTTPSTFVRPLEQGRNFYFTLVVSCKFTINFGAVVVAQR